MRNTDELRQLHDECEQTLSKYTAASRETCQLLHRLTGDEIPSREDFVEAVAKRITENEMHQRYRHAREAVFAAMKAIY